MTMKMSRLFFLSALLSMFGVLDTMPAYAGPSTCTTLFERGVRELAERPRLYASDFNQDGSARTKKAQRYERETQGALAVWEQARRACLREAENASEFRDAARWTSKSYEIAAEILRVRGDKLAACETFVEGIEAVEAIEPRSPHAASLYAQRGFCVSETDGVQGAVLAEQALELVIEAYGSRDARVVDRMIDLAIILPYSVAPYGDLSTVSGPEIQVVELRVAELRRAAWETVQADPKATAEMIQRAAASFRSWQVAYGEDEVATRQIEAALIEARRKQDDR